MGKHNVYMYICKCNGKKYIGQTCMTLEERAKINGQNYKECSYFWNAICKYGWNNFDSVILKENLTQDEANYWEMYYISKFNTTNRDIGYNLTYGGCGNVPTIEAKQHMSENHADVTGAKHPNARSIYLLNTGECFGSTLEASEKYGSNRKSINSNCRGIIHYAGVSHDGVPLQWCYYEDRENRVFNPNLIIKGGALHKRPVYCLTTNEEFDSVSDAAQKYNVCESSIRQVIAFKRRYAGVLDDGRTLQWCDLKNKSQCQYDPDLKPKNANQVRPVYCKELNQVFENVKAASQHTNINAVNIVKVCNHCKGYYTAGKLHWQWYDSTTIQN